MIAEREVGRERERERNIDAPLVRVHERQLIDVSLMDLCLSYTP